MPLTLEQLPADILLLVLQYLDLVAISRLSQTCPILYSFVEGSGWKAYVAANPVPSPSLTLALESLRWRPKDLLRNQALAEGAWKARGPFVVRPLGPEWPTKLHPVMAISPSRLVVAAGNALFLYKFIPPTQSHSTPRIVFERIITFPKDARQDVTGVSFAPDGSEDRTLVLSFADGALGLVQIPQSSDASRRRNVAVRAPTPSYLRGSGASIRSMCTNDNLILTLDSVGVASIYSLRDPTPTPVSYITLGYDTSPVSGWSAHLTLQTSSGFAVLGTSSPMPLVVHPITESNLHPSPQALLSPSIRSDYFPAPAAVYSICGATQTFPWASPSNQIVISGWYHGVVTLHDLRCPTHSISTTRAPHLAPALTLRDPMTLSPIYSLTSAGARVAAGSAQHSLIHLHDVRSPKAGWSVYLPQPQRGHSASSPVYSCLLEGTRLWAATESRAFVLDFTQGVSERTFPPVNDRIGGTRGISWPVTFYDHDMFLMRRESDWSGDEGVHDDGPNFNTAV